jgi:DNA-binding GntR family transcriptional regulator
VVERRKTEVRRVFGALPVRAAVAAEQGGAGKRVRPQELRARGSGPDAGLKGVSEPGEKPHEQIAESCENRLLAEMIRSLRGHFARFRSLSLRLPEKVLSSRQERLAITGAPKRGDGDAAEKLVCRHFDHAARFLPDSILARPTRTAGTRVMIDLE